MLFLCLFHSPTWRHKTAASVGPSPDRSNKVRPDLVVAAITSQIPPTLGDDEMLLSGNELKESGLPKPSIIEKFPEEE